MASGTTSVVKSAINELITTATTYELFTLDKIYHDSLQVLMIELTGTNNK